jgi:hypothetical protein
MSSFREMVQRGVEIDACYDHYNLLRTIEGQLRARDARRRGREVGADGEWRVARGRRIALNRSSGSTFTCAHDGCHVGARPQALPLECAPRR